MCCPDNRSSSNACWWADSKCLWDDSGDVVVGECTDHQFNNEQTFTRWTNSLVIKGSVLPGSINSFWGPMALDTLQRTHIRSQVAGEKFAHISSVIIVIGRGTWKPTYRRTIAEKLWIRCWRTRHNSGVAQIGWGLMAHARHGVTVSLSQLEQDLRVSRVCVGKYGSD